MLSVGYFRVTGWFGSVAPVSLHLQATHCCTIEDQGQRELPLFKICWQEVKSGHPVSCNRPSKLGVVKAMLSTSRIKSRGELGTFHTLSETAPSARTELIERPRDSGRRGADMDQWAVRTPQSNSGRRLPHPGRDIQGESNLVKKLAYHFLLSKQVSSLLCFVEDFLGNLPQPQSHCQSCFPPEFS